LIGTPFLSGFYSKDAIIEAAHLALEAAEKSGSAYLWIFEYAYWGVLLGVFITALYTFRMIFMTFHGKERWRTAEVHHGAHADAAHAVSHDAHAKDAGHGHDAGHAAHGNHDDHGHGGVHVPKESPAVVWVPLVMLAFFSVVIGFLTVGPVLFGDFFSGVIYSDAAHDVIGEMATDFHGPVAFTIHGMTQWPFFLAAAGVLVAYLFYLRNPSWADAVQRRLSWLYNLLVNKYYFDWFNEKVLAPLARGLGFGLWKGGDQGLIDGLLVNGSARSIGWFAGVVRHVQTGYLYHYAFAMIIGLSALLAWLLLR